VPISGWHRDIEIGGDVSLHHLNDVIQKVLGWDNTHLYAFAVNDKHYAHLGDDDYIVNDAFDNYSAKISLGALGLHKGNTFVYKYDFGDRHLFPLTVLWIEKAKNSTDLARVIRFAGRDLIQYKTQNEEDKGQVFVSECSEKVDFKMVSSFKKGWSFREDFKKVDFVIARDNKILEQWRKSIRNSQGARGLGRIGLRFLVLTLGSNCNCFSTVSNITTCYWFDRYQK
jgi:pRiA4b ORF-3-like protein